MEIAIDIYLKQEDIGTTIIHSTVNENDIIELIENRIVSGEIQLPARYKSGKATIKISIDKVTI